MCKINFNYENFLEKGVVSKSSEDFMNSVKYIENNTEYMPVVSKDLIFSSDSDALYIVKKHESGYTKKYKVYPTARVGLENKLGITGPALDKLSGEELVNLFTLCAEKYRPDEELKVAKFKNAALAVLSDNYKEISAYKTFKEAEKEVTRLGGSFLAGSLEKDYFRAIYSINNADLRGFYYNKLPELKNATPVVEVFTSNTGLSSVAIIPRFRIRNLNVIIGKPNYVMHKGDADFNYVKENIKGIYAQFKSAIEGLAKLKDIKIKYPENCIENISKRLLLSKKYTVRAIEDFESTMLYDDEVTAYDIYFAICEMLNYAKQDNKPGTVVSNLEEQISKILYLDFGKYDTEDE